jgi:hypothetical protein
MSESVRDGEAAGAGAGAGAGAAAAGHKPTSAAEQRKYRVTLYADNRVRFCSVSRGSGSDQHDLAILRS